MLSIGLLVRELLRMKLGLFVICTSFVSTAWNSWMLFLLFINRAKSCKWSILFSLKCKYTVLPINFGTGCEKGKCLERVDRWSQQSHTLFFVHWWLHWDQKQTNMQLSQGRAHSRWLLQVAPGQLPGWFEQAAPKPMYLTQVEFYADPFRAYYTQAWPELPWFKGLCLLSATS